MSDPSTNPFDDANASHPLDLLINAISGSGEYEIPPEAREGHGEFNLEQLLGNDSTGESSRNKRKRSGSPTTEGDGKIVRIVKTHIIQASSERSKPNLIKPNREHGDSTFSTVEVWHPTAGQKSYGKERRMLNPPPILRVSGPLLPLLTQATLQTVLIETDLVRPNGVLSSQSQRIPLSTLPEPTPQTQAGLTLKRAEKEEKTRILREQASRHGFAQTLRFERNRLANRERQALSDGLTFPALWVADLIGKDKEFMLELNLGMPGIEASEPLAMDANIPGDPLAPTAPGEPATDAEIIVQQSNNEPTPTDLFGEHQTLDQASNDIIDQLTEEDRRLLEAEPRADPDPPSDPTSIAGQSAVAGPALSTPWASFTSAPLSVVSKPSQKTAKARSMNSCFALDDSFSLWVRINSQTVRTKYMKLDDGHQPCLTTRTNQWTPFKFEVTENAAMSLPSEGSSSHRERERLRKSKHNDVLTYGSLGHLVDLQSGVKTELMRLVKIDKGENVVGTDHGHPVSDLQRVGFVRLQDGRDDYTGGSRWYLSAPGARLGGAELHRLAQTSQATTSSDIDPQTLDGASEGEVQTVGKAKSKRKPKTKRFALAEVVVAEDQGGAQFALSWHKADRYEGERVRGFGKELVKKLEMCEKVEDWMCWVLGGVDNFKYSFFDGQELGTLFDNPIDPIARHLQPPIFNTETDTLTLTLNEFFHTTHGTSDFKVYLGPIGPISASLYRSVAPEKAGPDNGHSMHFEAQPYDSTVQDDPSRRIRSDYPGHKPHVIVAIHMPPAEKIIRAMQECFAEAQYQPASTLQAVPEDGGGGSDGWLTANDAAILAGPEEHVQSTNASTEHEVLSLNLDPALNAEVATSAQTHHDVDDITAALAAHADDPAFSLSHMDNGFLPSDLDPALDASASVDQNQGLELAQPKEESLNTIETFTQPEAQAQVSIDTVSDLQLSKPEQDLKQVEMVPLPIVLVRSVDGVGFTVGRNVVAERVDSRMPGEKVRWGLRVVAA